MTEPVSIKSMFSVSALGAGADEIWMSYDQGTSLISKVDFDSIEALVSRIGKEHWSE